MSYATLGWGDAAEPAGGDVVDEAVAAEVGAEEGAALEALEVVADGLVELDGWDGVLFQNSIDRSSDFSVVMAEDFAKAFHPSDWP